MTARRRTKLLVLIPLFLLAAFVAVRHVNRPRAPMSIHGEWREPPMAVAPPGGHGEAHPAWPADVRWAEGDVAGDAAGPREPHTSMATLEAFVVERVAAHVAELGERTPVIVAAGTGDAEPVADVLRRRLAAAAAPPPVQPVEVEPPAGPVPGPAPTLPPSPAPVPSPSPAPAPPPVTAPPHSSTPAPGAAPPQAPTPTLTPGPAAVAVSAAAPSEAPMPAPAPAPLQLPAPDPAPAGWETVVTVSWRHVQYAAVPWWPTPLKAGELAVRVDAPGGEAVVVARLDEKPWVSRARPGVLHDQGYVVVASGSPAATPDEAREKVRRMSVDALAEVVGSRTRSRFGGRRTSDGELRRQAEYAITGGRAVVDQCVVSVQRPYGEVWYAASLLNAGPGAVEPLAHAAVVSEQVRRRTFAGMVAATLGMMLVLGVVYLALNALTRGYFRTHLRVAAVAVVAVAVVVMMLVVG